MKLNVFLRNFLKSTGNLKSVQGGSVVGVTFTFALPKDPESKENCFKRLKISFQQFRKVVSIQIQWFYQGATLH